MSHAEIMRNLHGWGEDFDATWQSSFLICFWCDAYILCLSRLLRFYIPNVCLNYSCEPIKRFLGYTFKLVFFFLKWSETLLPNRESQCLVVTILLLVKCFSINIEISGNFILFFTVKYHFQVINTCRGASNLKTLHLALKDLILKQITWLPTSTKSAPTHDSNSYIKNQITSKSQRFVKIYNKIICRGLELNIMRSENPPWKELLLELKAVRLLLGSFLCSCLCPKHSKGSGPVRLRACTHSVPELLTWSYLSSCLEFFSFQDYCVIFSHLEEVRQAVELDPCSIKSHKQKRSGLSSLWLLLLVRSHTSESISSIYRHLFFICTFISSRFVLVWRYNV